DLASGTLFLTSRAYPFRMAQRAELSQLWTSMKFPNAATTSAKTVIAAPYRWSDGNIVGLKIFHSTDAPNVSANVRLRVRAITRAVNVSIATPEEDESFTVSVLDNLLRYNSSTIAFGSPLAFSRGDFLGLRIDRVGGDVADTMTGNWHLIGVALMYEGEGPDSSGSGTWNVPPIGV
ncbi:MAG TPA: hypothetical protein VEC60_15295, partial [Reyranella sp.]|nr:hypothetical protein [Reyranella sp.]